MPLTHPARTSETATTGMIVLITRDADGYAASCKLATSIYRCVGAADPAAEAALEAAIDARRAAGVRRLRRAPVAPERTWLAGEGWALTYD